MLHQLERAQGSIVKSGAAHGPSGSAPLTQSPGPGLVRRNGAWGTGAHQRVIRTLICYCWNLVVEAVVRRVSGRIPNGAIICLHDGYELRCKLDVRATIAAVERLIPMLLDCGYRLETVGQPCQTT